MALQQFGFTCSQVGQCPPARCRPYLALDNPAANVCQKPDRNTMPPFASYRVPGKFQGHVGQDHEWPVATATDICKVKGIHDMNLVYEIQVTEDDSAVCCKTND